MDEDDLKIKNGARVWLIHDEHTKEESN